MASTRNINTPNDYCIKNKEWSNILDYNLYKNSAYGVSVSNAYSQAGMNMGKIPRDILSKNPIEIESSLFGINSTNLVNPSKPVVPQLNNLPTAHFFDRLPVYMPEPLIIEKNQRPFPLPQ